MANHTVSQGESIPSIALDTGFFWETLWNDGNNAALKAKRKNPNVLYPGDTVFIPELQKKSVSRPTEQRHKFHRKGDPIQIVIKLMKHDKPRANEPYILEIDGKALRGTTDGDGIIKQPIPGDASSGILRLGAGGKEVFPVSIGGLDPVDTISGAQQRLINLGFTCDQTGELDDATTRALSKFQSKYNLDPNGTMDTPTQNKLLDLTQ